MILQMITFAVIALLMVITVCLFVYYLALYNPH